MSLNTNVPVEPHENIVRSTITSVQLNNIVVTLGVTASCTVYMYDISGNIKNVVQSQLTSEQYSQWGTDDEFFVQCILQNLGLTPLPTLTPPEPTISEPTA
jgi:hypothetical protein